MESLALDSVDELLGQANRLGHAVGAARQHPADRRRQRDPVAHGDVEGADVIAGPEDGSDPPAAEHKRRPPATPGRGLDVLADEARLGAPHARPVQEHSEVGGEAEAPRVSDPLAVEEPEVGSDPEATSGAEEDRPFAEGQVAGHVGERHTPFRPRRGHRVQARERHDRDAREDGAAVRREGAIGAGDEPDGPRPVADAEPPLERYLDLLGFTDR